MSRSPLAQSKNWMSASSSKRQLSTKFNTSSSSSNNNKIVNNNHTTTTTMNGTNSEHVQLLIAGLVKQHEQMVAFLKSDLDDNKLEQEEVLSTGIMKLPKSIRTMSVKDFNSQHQGCNLLALLKSKDGVVLSSSSSSSSGSSGTTTSNGVVSATINNINDHNNTKDATKKRCYQTPAHQNTMRSRFGNGTRPGTVLRTARRGEGIFSQNGSPLAANEPGTIIATVAKKRRGNLNNEDNDPSSSLSAATATANVEINVGEGQYVSLNDPNGVTELNAEMKKTAASQLKVLQEQMACLMAQLQ